MKGYALMKKQSITAFQTRLSDAVRNIEQVSQVEIVVIVRSRSADYRESALTWGLFGALLSFTYLMFAPDLFTDEFIYCLTILGFAFSYTLARIPWCIRLSVKKERLQKNVEIMARALFQKGGIQHTQAKIGLLIYCSLLEKTVYLLPDRGVAMALPLEEWQKIQNDLQTIFADKNPSEALLLQLQLLPPLFAHYLPVLPNDINELPDNMEIDL
jgi:putative membrane protein